MSKPIIAVVGRPNVGKSTLFNKLIGERRSIVEDTPGVTRDRIYGETEWNGRQLVLIDTGGIEPKTNDIIPFYGIVEQISINVMEVIKTDIEGVVIIEPRIFKDDRGYFYESFSQREFEEKVCRTDRKSVV